MPDENVTRDSGATNGPARPAAEIGPADRAYLELSERIALEENPARIVTAALGTAVELARADRGRAFLLDAELRRLYCVARKTRHAESEALTNVGEAVLDLGDASAETSPVGVCLRDDRAVRLADAYQYTGYDVSAIQTWDGTDLAAERMPAGSSGGQPPRTGAVLAMPLRDHTDRAVGALLLQRLAQRGGDTAVRFPDSTINQVARFTRHAATAVTAARLAAENRDLWAGSETGARPGRSTQPDASPATRPDSPAFEPLIGHSAALRTALHLAARAAPTNVTVLIQGETGTGKDVLARAIHDASPRADKPFIAQNCAAIPETMLEAELFGWEKGAFSGAHAANPGLIARADGGSLFLDEIGDLPLDLQPKLLRVLQDGRVRAIGSARERKVDVRILVATHRDLPSRVDDGRFRADLYYRLAVFPVTLSPLRDRPEDLPLLVDHFLIACRDRLGSQVEGVAPEVMAALATRSWRGNVRELRNVIERAVLLAGPESRTLTSLPDDHERSLTPEPPAQTQSNTPDSHGDVRGHGHGEHDSDGGLDELSNLPLKDAVERVEQRLIRLRLRDAGGNQAEAARRLGVPRRTLSYKIQRYGIDTDPGV